MAMIQGPPVVIVTGDNVVMCDDNFMYITTKSHLCGWDYVDQFMNELIYMMANEDMMRLFGCKHTPMHPT